ncbi:phosphatase PAP2 family protein [Algibacter pacificus]|uniref:phosphatase PAP2 family protein n=1 Tax=Algibacter pacificus TaxID=2599389 RepID=UPI0011CBF145|nr:phosphatase PAP2 family protein [Algibacter pacificus]
MFIKQASISLFVLLFSCKLNAQNLLYTERPTDTSSIGQLAVYDFKETVKSIGHSFSRPFHWKKKDFNTLGTFLVSTLALSTIDDETSALFVKNKPHVPHIFMEVGTRFGKPQLYFIANAALYGTALFTKNEKLRKASVLIISSSVTTGILQSISKTVIGRARPKNTTENVNSRDFEFWSDKPAYHSFPSGHTVLSVTMAHAIAKQFDNPWSKIAVYSLGSIAPISRLFAGAHWLTDIGVATFLSIVVVDSVDNFLFQTKAYSYPNKPKRVAWNIAFSGNQIGLIGRF